MKEPVTGADATLGDWETKPAKDAKTRKRMPRKQEMQGRTIEGVIRIHARGFGFISSIEAAEDLFAPVSVLEGILDGDRVEAFIRDGGDAASRLTLVKRTRTRIVADPENGYLVADKAIGQLRLKTGARLSDSHAYLVDISNGQPRVLEDLGLARSDSAVTRRVLERYNLPYLQPQAALEQAARHQQPVISKHRRDFRGSCVFTIDDDHSTDLDDAISVAADPDGSLRIWVHISDVAQHIEPGTAIDTSAAACPNSVYLPQHTRHMLPPTLASDRLSLIPNSDRETLTVELRIDAEGNVKSVDVYESVIRSKERLSYATVARVLSGDTSGVDTDIVKSLRLARAAAIRLGIDRAHRGGIDSWQTDPEPAGARGEEPAHLLIERLMVATNEAVAVWCHARNLPTLYRTHAAFTDASAQELELAAEGFGLYAGLPRPVTAVSFAALAAQAEQAGVGPAFQDATRPLLARAKYQTDLSIHFGLGSGAYLHFTSPLRRYADLLTHRMVKDYLAGRRGGVYAKEQLDEYATIINEVNQAASKAERDARTTMGLLDLKARQVRQATVVSVSGRGTRVRLDGPAGVIGVLTQGGGHVGKRIAVRVRAVDALRGTLELSPAGKKD